jgi:hypothetical protein
MSISYRFSSLDDAFHFFNQAKGAPNIASSTPLIDRCCRVSILLSWAAVEEALAETEAALAKKGLPTLATGLLTDRLNRVSVLQRRRKVNHAAFIRHRRLRNKLAHPTKSSHAVNAGVKEAHDTFQFCLAVVRRVFPHPVHVAPY